MKDPHGSAPRPKRTKRRARSTTPRPQPQPQATLPNATTPIAYAPVLKAGVRATVQTVQDMHRSISDKTFSTLQRVPGLAVPAGWVQGVHDAITHGVYAGVRHGSGALMSIAGVAEQLGTDTHRLPRGPERAVRSALNGVFGDALAQAGSPLALPMGFHDPATGLALTPDALSSLHPRVCVFIHGLACDEQSWRRGAEAWSGTPWEHTLPAGEPIHYGALLADELGVSPIYLRYNSGLPIADNAQRLADMLDSLITDAPAGARELVLIGHSMGGLLARGACHGAKSAARPWLDRVRLMVCLGTPHHGAPLEQLGHLANTALGATEVTQPLGRIAQARSQGIKDLRHGLKSRSSAKTPVPPRPMALRLLAGSLGDSSSGVMGSLLGRVLGDGLVLPSSAVDDGMTGDVQRVELAGLGHMALLNHPRVYAQLREWVIEIG